MDDFIEVVGLSDLLDRESVLWRDRNFEDICDGLVASQCRADLVNEIESKVHSYFAGLYLPDAANVYDYLLLCLREKDVIATFNWDPFLAQAYQRNSIARRLPRILFLHGNVAIGYCNSCRVKGYVWDRCDKCGQPLQSAPLLYPLKNKDYASDPLIANEWNELRRALGRAYLLTIFGYSAPSTDVEAVKLMLSAWNTNESRLLAEVEIVDTKPEAELRSAWEQFVAGGIHYYTVDSLLQTWLSSHPRRSCESLAQATLINKPWRENPVPRFDLVGQLQDWVAPLIFEEDRLESAGTPFSGLPIGGSGATEVDITVEGGQMILDDWPASLGRFLVGLAKFPIELVRAYRAGTEPERSERKRESQMPMGALMDEMLYAKQSLKYAMDLSSQMCDPESFAQNRQGLAVILDRLEKSRKPSALDVELKVEGVPIYLGMEETDWTWQATRELLGFKKAHLLDLVMDDYGRSAFHVKNLAFTLSSGNVAVAPYPPKSQYNQGRRTWETSVFVFFGEGRIDELSCEVLCNAEAQMVFFARCYDALKNRFGEAADADGHPIDRERLGQTSEIVWNDGETFLTLSNRGVITLKQKTGESRGHSK